MGCRKNLQQNRSQPSKEQSRDNREEGNGKPPHPLPSQKHGRKILTETYGAGWRDPQAEKHPAKNSACMEMNTVQFPFGLFCPFLAELMKQLS